MSSNDEPMGGLDIDHALDDARDRVQEIANLELAIKGYGKLSQSEQGLLSFGVGQGWVTCLEFLSENGYIDIDYK